ncbi:MAG: hypothetical protein ABIR51_08580 [Sphingomicrobium sp.]
MIAAFALLISAALTVPTGEAWAFRIDHGQPAHAHRVAPGAKPAPGEVMISVTPLMGTTMIATNNSTTAYTYRAQLVGAAGLAKTCALPPGNSPTIEMWTQRAIGVRVGDFKPAPNGGACP